MVHCRYGDILQAIISKAENEIALEYSLWFFALFAKSVYVLVYVAI